MGQGEGVRGMRGQVAGLGVGVGETWARRKDEGGLLSVLHGESSTRLAPPRNAKDRKHLQST